MQKTWIHLLLGATLFTPLLTHAADVKIYGRAHVSLDYLDDGKNYNEIALSSNASRLGFKVEHQVNADLTAFAQIEQQINFTSGAEDSKDSVDFATRDTYVGLKGDFGQVKVGRFDSPFKSARASINHFGDQLGDLRTITRAYDHRFDERNPNTIEYQSPQFAGNFTAKAALSLHDGTMIADESTADSNEKSRAYDLGLNYQTERVSLAAAYEHYEEDVSRGERDGIRLVANYIMSPALQLGGLYQFTTLDQDIGVNADAHVLGVVADYKFADKTSIRGQVFHREVDSDDANSTLFTLGLEQRFDRQLRMYANVAVTMNDEYANLTPWSQARSNKPAQAQGANALGETALGLSLGMRYDF